jgi:hypothetical protein
MKANPTTPEAGELSELALRCEGAVPAEEWELIREAGKLVFPDLNREDHTNARFHINQLCDSGGFIDAAMTLVPEADWEPYGGATGPWNVTMATAYGSASVMPTDGKSTGIHDKRGGHGRAATPALALCAACLRARTQEPHP